MTRTTFPFPAFEMPSLKGIDADAIVAAQQRNIDAMGSASNILVDGARAFGERQTAIMQARMDALAKRTEAALAGPKFTDLGTSVELIKQSYAQAVADTRELLDIVAKAQTDALNVVNTCMMTNLDEMKKLAA